MTLKFGFHQPIHLRHVSAVLPRLPAAFSPLRILHFSDIHLANREKQDNRLLDLLSSVSADMLAFTGDALHRFDSPGTLALDFFRKLTERVHPRLGLHMVHGNHDTPHSVRLLKEAGFNILLNEHTLIGRGDSSWYVIGVHDSRYSARAHHWRCNDLPTALIDVPSDAFKILLAHSPDVLPEAARFDIDMVLAGHTHGGQIRLPWFGALLTNTKISQRYSWGLQTFGKTLCHTTSGASSSFPPIRLSCPQEVVLLELVRG